MIPTYAQQLDLVRQGFATAKVNKNLTTFKYHRKVMYDNLWHKIPGILECRGHTYDNTNGQLVLLPPQKTFNYMENDTWKDIPLDTQVKIYRKYNGFMASLSVYKGKVIIGTTGTTNSEYAKLARETIRKSAFGPLKNIAKWNEGATWLFEIMHKSDLHIVKEEFGVQYLGCRTHCDPYFIPMLISTQCTLKSAIQLSYEVEHEGFMVHLASDPSKICKLKSSYYKSKKNLMRANELKVKQMFNNPEGYCNNYSIDSRFHTAVESIVNTFSKDDWMKFSDQERRNEIESYL